MRVLTLDPSTNCGWCHGVYGGKPIYGVQKLPAGRFSLKALALEDFLIVLMRGNKISRVYVEKPIIPRITSFESVMSMAGIASTIAITTARLGVDMFYVDQQTWRSEFMGVTRAPKMKDDEVERILLGGTNDPDRIRKFRNAMGSEKTRKAKTSEARRRWLKSYTMERCRAAGHPVEDDNEADALAMWLMLQKREEGKAASPQFDLTNGLDL